MTLPEYVTVVFRALTLFLGAACLIVAGGEFFMSLRAGRWQTHPSEFMRWLGRFVLVLFAFVAIEHGLQTHHAFTWRTALPFLGFFFLLAGYTTEKNGR